MGKLDEKTFELDLAAMPVIPDRCMHGQRSIKSLQELMNEDIAKEADLIPVEVIVGRLYTGSFSPLSASMHWVAKKLNLA